MNPEARASRPNAYLCKTLSSNECPKKQKILTVKGFKKSDFLVVGCKPVKVCLIFKALKDFLYVLNKFLMINHLKLYVLIFVCSYIKKVYYDNDTSID